MLVPLRVQPQMTARCSAQRSPFFRGSLHTVPNLSHYETLCPLVNQDGCFQKYGKTPQIIHLCIGFSILYLHHPFWGFSPYSWKHPHGWQQKTCAKNGCQWGIFFPAILFDPWNSHFRPWKLLVGRCSFPFGFRPIFRGELLVSGSVSKKYSLVVTHCYLPHLQVIR